MLFYSFSFFILFHSHNPQGHSLVIFFTLLFIHVVIVIDVAEKCGVISRFSLRSLLRSVEALMKSLFYYQHLDIWTFGRSVPPIRSLEVIDIINRPSHSQFKNEGQDRACTILQLVSSKGATSQGVGCWILYLLEYSVP